MPPHHLQPGTSIGLEYKIAEQIGEGGFAITYLAHDRALDIPVAIKEFFPAGLARREGDGSVCPAYEKRARQFEDARDLFMREANTLARIQHKNIVRVYRVLSINNTAYIVLEYLSGGDMSKALERGILFSGNRPVIASEFRTFFAPLLDALKHIHEMQLLHCDVKPANILMRSDRGDPVLIDFGAARPQGNKDDTQIGITDGYGPIEVYSDDSRKHMGPWTDIYGLSAVMYRVLTGSVPAPSTDRIIDDTVRKLAGDPRLPRISEFEQSTLEAIDWGLSVRPNDRPRTVTDWTEKLFSSKTKLSGARLRHGATKKVFISYRRLDSEHIAGRICDRLKVKYAKDQIFFDVDAIPLGVDFRTHVRTAIRQSAVIVAVIGPDWFHARQSRSWFGWRSQPKEDHVQVELEVAVELGIPILPLLVNNASAEMLKQTPPSLRSVQYLNAAFVRAGRDFHHDMDLVESQIDHWLGEC